MSYPKIDPHSATWKVVTDWCQDRAQMLRSHLEGDITHEESIKIRASLREINRIRALATSDTPLIDEDQTVYLPE